MFSWQGYEIEALVLQSKQESYESDYAVAVDSQ